MEYLLYFYLAIPAFLANMAPVIAVKMGWGKRFLKPVDAGKSWRGYRILGDHKTYLGFMAGIMAATFIALVQYGAGKAGLAPWPVPYGLAGTFAYGFLAGFGALAGDAAESFIKRQLGIQSGRPFIPFDQIDYIFGFLAFTYPVYAWDWRPALFLLAFAAIANPLSNLFAYVLRIKPTYW